MSVPGRAARREVPRAWSVLVPAWSLQLPAVGGQLEVEEDWSWSYPMVGLTWLLVLALWSWLLLVAS